MTIRQDTNIFHVQTFGVFSTPHGDGSRSVTIMPRHGDASGGEVTFYVAPNLDGLVMLRDALNVEIERRDG